MERTKKVETPVVGETRLRWRKTGGGSLRWHNKIIKPGEIFLAHAEDLPKAFMDSLVCLDPIEVQKEKKAVQEKVVAPPVLYKLEKDTKSKSHWNVVNEEGKPINETPLEKEHAEALLTSLS